MKLPVEGGHLQGLWQICCGQTCAPARGQFFFSRRGVSETLRFRLAPYGLGANRIPQNFKGGGGCGGGAGIEPNFPHEVVFNMFLPPKARKQICVHVTTPAWEPQSCSSIWIGMIWYDVCWFYDRQGDFGWGEGLQAPQASPALSTLYFSSLN